MEKFGLPDIVVNDFPWSINESIGSLINLSAQSLIEGTSINDDLSIDVDLDRIRNDPFRLALKASLLAEASGKGRIHFRPAIPEEGDPDNYLLEIDFDAAAGTTVHEKQDSLISEVFGAEDSIVYIQHNKKLLAASNRARQRMPELRERFNAGLEPGESIMVKAPFTTSDGGREWMWVEVIEWNGNDIRGLLSSDPYHVPGLRAGAEVRVDQQDLFDYIFYLADGSSEGNETGEIILQMQGR
jgi:uncharacterized protein YegJ (DUF2314 family)